MSNDKPLSSVDSTYNNLRDIQSTSYLDSPNTKMFDMYSKKPNYAISNKAMVDTQTYLQQIENKYKPHKKQNRKKKADNSSSSSYNSVQDSDNDSNGYSKVNTKSNNQENAIPPKFKQIVQQQTSKKQQMIFHNSTPKHQEQQKNNEFIIPQYVSLSRGASERIYDIPSQHSQAVNQEQHWQVLEKMHEEYQQNRSQQNEQYQQNQPQQHSEYLQNPSQQHEEYQINRSQYGLQQTNKTLDFNSNYKQDQDHSKQFDQSRISQNRNDLKSKFFEMTIQLKNQLPPGHKGQSVLVAQLYSQCMKENIEQQQWSQWIQYHL